MGLPRGARPARRPPRPPATLLPRPPDAARAAATVTGLLPRPRAAARSPDRCGLDTAPRRGPVALPCILAPAELACTLRALVQPLPAHRYATETAARRCAQRLAAEWPGAGLACLPNWAFALPLGRWLRAQQRAARLGAALARSGGGGRPGGAAGGGNAARAAEEEGGGEGEDEAAAAGEALAQAVLLHPLAIVRLLERCGSLAPVPAPPGGQAVVPANAGRCTSAEWTDSSECRWAAALPVRERCILLDMAVEALL